MNIQDHLTQDRSTLKRKYDEEHDTQDQSPMKRKYEEEYDTQDHSLEPDLIYYHIKVWETILSICP